MHRVELVGPSGVGKTTAFRAALGARPFLRASAVPTEGALVGAYPRAEEVATAVHQGERLARHLPPTIHTIRRASYLAQTEGQGIALIDEGVAQRALNLVALRAPASHVQAYLTAAPIAKATYVFLEAPAPAIERRGAQRERPILPRPLLDLVAASASTCADILEARGADVIRIDARRPAAAVLVDLLAVTDQRRRPEAPALDRRVGITPLTLSPYIEWLTTGVPFALSRWGDGEWRAILGHGGQTCDGQAYTSDLRQDLIAALARRPDYLLGLQGLAIRRFGPAIRAWLAAHALTPRWVESEVFARASLQGKLPRLVRALQGRTVVLVGPAHLRPLAAITPAHVVEVPAANAHADRDRVLAELEAVLRLGPKAGPVVLLSAGPLANVLVDRLAPAWPEVTWLDVGSIWEPYVGLATRTYHRDVLAGQTHSGRVAAGKGLA